MIIEFEIAPDLKIMIDDTDKHIVNKHKWYLHKNKRSIITSFREGGKKITFTIGRYILSEYGHTFDKNELVCYKDHDFLNNTKSNLVIRSSSENNKNRRIGLRSIRGSFNKRKLPYGVYWHGKTKMYRAVIRVNGKLRWLGNHILSRHAEEAVDNAMKRFGYRRRNE